MKRMRLGKIAIATTTFACATLLSFGWSEQRGVSLSIESAQARVGRPLTPVSVAGVARRQYRRGAYGYGAGVVGVGLAAGAIGTAAVAATSPWGYGYGATYDHGPVMAADYHEGYGLAGHYYATSPWGDYACQPGHIYGCHFYTAEEWGSGWHNSSGY